MTYSRGQFIVLMYAWPDSKDPFWCGHAHVSELTAEACRKVLEQTGRKTQIVRRYD